MEMSNAEVMGGCFNISTGEMILLEDVFSILPLAQDRSISLEGIALQLVLGRISRGEDAKRGLEFSFSRDI